MPKELSPDSPYAIRNAALIEARNSMHNNLNVYVLHDTSIFEDIVLYINRYVEDKPFVLLLYYDNKLIRPHFSHFYEHGFNLVNLSDPDRMIITSTKYNCSAISNDAVFNTYQYLTTAYEDYLANKLVESL